jgi:hypothetical protein
LASAVLHTIGIDAALIGDLEEASRAGRSRFWYVRQVAGVVLCGSLPPFVAGWVTLLIAVTLFHMAVAGPLWIAARETGRGSPFQVAWLSGGYLTFALAAWFVTRFHRKAGAARVIRNTARVVLAIVIAAIIIELCATAAVVFAAAAPRPQAEWSDPSPHTASFVAVENDVRLEVLDWGGSGPALVLLAGLGDTAHMYDDVGPVLATHYRVVGITRRGHRGSSAPMNGYTSDDPAVRERVDASYRLERENVTRHARRFAAFAEQGRVVEIPGGHDLLVSNPREVVTQIDAFVSSLPPTP